MSEIPELEFFAFNLEKHFKDKILERLEVMHLKKLPFFYKQFLKQNLQGHRLHNVRRDGRTLLMIFRRNRSLSLHPILSGKVEILSPEIEIRNPIISFHFKDGTGFALTDPLKQAMVKLNPEPSIIPDVLSDEFTSSYFETMLKKENVTIKKALVDQQIARGIGDNYADEILWQASISPFSMARAVPKHKVQLLHQLIGQVYKAHIILFQDISNGEIVGDINDHFNIHNPDKKVSPTGGKITVYENGLLKTYYTEEQVLFE